MFNISTINDILYPRFDNNIPILRWGGMYADHGDYEEDEDGEGNKTG